MTAASDQALHDAEGSVGSGDDKNQLALCADEQIHDGRRIPANAIYGDYTVAGHDLRVRVRVVPRLHEPRPDSHNREAELRQVDAQLLVGSRLAQHHRGGSRRNRT
mmetsp:Transcript_94534/g.262609  ORF Transcript_94534/g.262609 Transcript_94534/m.262609 type:complete len:106 (-) Transcript_94534:171-488(-)